MAAPKMEVWVKGDPSTKTLGDCPFCHRALLTLEEKSVPYTKGYVDFANKPEWLLQVNPAGSVPVAKDLESNEWVADSAVIADYLEKKFPEPPLGTTETAPDVGGKVFPALVGMIKATSSEEAAEKEAALLSELRAIEAHLSSVNGPYIGGESLTATDVALAPKLHHVVTALGGLKDWELPAEFVEIRKFLDAMKARPSWAATSYPDEFVIKGWKAKMPSA